MSERDGFEPGVPCRVQGVYRDPPAAAAFYSELFGWGTENLMAADDPGDYFVCRLRDREVAAIVSQHGAPAPSSAVWTTHVWVDGADDAAARVGAAGGTVIGEPFDSPGGGRQAVVADPSGAVFCLWEPRARGGAQLVNEPGAWAMSALHTPDPEACKRFYGAVFNWESESFDVGDAQMTLWKLPGYVGGEPQQPVARDVIGTMLPTGGDGAAASPGWSVDFWIGNVDEAADKAKRLGGEVISGPYDVPNVGMRQAVVADPQGATLSLTQPPGLA